MSGEREHVLAAAEAIADGVPFDWEGTAGGNARERDLAVLLQLRVVERIAEVHRTLPSAGPPTGAPGEPSEAVTETVPAIPLRWGALRLLEKVGEGGFGEVFRAWDERLDREVALKLLRCAESERADLASAVIREGRLLARVRHANVATVFGADRHDGRVGLWMEFLRGQTLGDLVRTQGPLGAREALLIGIDLARALAAVHRAGLVHRDIKAQNVMREAGGRIVLMDFGAGLDLRDLSRRARLALSGTPHYMAPEVLHGFAATARSDIYSLGVLLYHLVTGRYPIEPRAFADLREAHEQGRYTLLRDARPDLPRAFLQAAERAMAPDPERRFPTAGAMEAALEEALGSGVVARRTGEGGKEREGRRLEAILRWGPVKITLAATFGVLAVALLILRPMMGRKPGATRLAAVTGQGYSREGAPAGSMSETRDRAALLLAMGAYPDARALYERLLAEQVRTLGDEEPAVAETLQCLAWTHQAEGDHAGAKALYARALRICEKRYGPYDPRVAVVLTGLASAAAQAGLAEEARDFLARVAAIRERSSGSEPPLESGWAGTAHLASLGSAPRETDSFTVEAALYRERRGRQERLASGDRVAVGDEMFLDLDVSQSVHAYVLNEDEQGRTYVLFPLSGLAPGNPLPAGRHRLPGARGAGPVNWRVDTAGGREHVLVLVSPAPLAELESEMVAAPHPAAEGLRGFAELPEPTAARLRGIGGLVERPTETAAKEPARLFERARALARRPEESRGVWIRQIDLENPGRAQR